MNYSNYAFFRYLTSCMVFITMQEKKGLISRFERASLVRAVNIMMRGLPAVTTVIHLVKDVQTCRRQIEKRGRAGELSKVDKRYLKGNFFFILTEEKRVG